MPSRSEENSKWKKSKNEKRTCGEKNLKRLEAKQVQEKRKNRKKNESKWKGKKEPAIQLHVAN